MDIKTLLKDAIEKKASDIHLTVASKPMYRINGTLISSEFEKLKPDDVKKLVLDLMNEKQKNHFEEYGEIDFSFGEKDLGRFRANVYKQRGSFACALRIVPSVIPDVDILGIPKSVMDLHKKRSGLILITGPTGSGKSTSLASIIDQINEKRRDHIITLEDPIEYVHSHKNCIVNQREIGLDSTTYALALRAALRQDPDVILIGEMRDLETISTAITAAETGHLVLSTLHTTRAVSTVERIIDVFPSQHQQQIRVQLATVLVSVVSQLLFKEKNGKGRVAAFEVMHNNAAIKNLIRENKTHQIQSVLQTSKDQGMQTMVDSILDLVKLGKIEKADALTHILDKQAFEKRLF